MGLARFVADEVALGVERLDAREAFLDVWTNEVDERVVRLRAAGVVTRCVGDLVLERFRNVVGITGTAGKTTTAWLVRQLLPGCVTSEARARNLWPTCSLLSAELSSWVVAELTSSHLAFCHRSPRVAVITSFWPDHVELHGSLDAYRAAKERLFRWQCASDVAVLPHDHPAAAALAAASPARRVWFSGSPIPGGGVWPEGDGIQVGGEQIPLERFPEPLRSGAGLRCLLAALATAWAVRGQIVSVPSLELPPHRWGADQTMAATPRKALALLRPGTSLVAGGNLGKVHSSAEERPFLEEWLEAIRSRCVSVDLFGDAGSWLSSRVGGTVHAGVLDAVRAASLRGGRVLVAPGFPMAQEDREAVSSFRW